MNTQNNNTNLNEDMLLKKFTRRDVDKAKENLLQRYSMWQGLLISNDEQSVITPDDLENFRIQARDLLDQDMKSDYEWEQLKILTVLIYLLIDADKDARPAGNQQLQQQMEKLQLPHAKDYIVRKILHNAEQLDFADIQRLATYENLVLSSYITSIPPDIDWQPGALEGLRSRDGVYFTLTDKDYEIEIGIAEAPEEPEEIDIIEPEVKPEPAKPRVIVEDVDYEPLVVYDNKANFLINTYRECRLMNGVDVSVASYVGMNREHNEDAVVVQPQNNRVVVVDAMGGYGNGVFARNIFVEALLKYPDDIQAGVEWTQKHYDEVDIDQGGVCLISLQIEADGDEYLVEFAQAGDVHAVLFDGKGNVRHETIDEAIGHQVINAVIGRNATIAQQANGWNNFGRLTRASLHAKHGWRLAVYSDGVANHFNANHIGSMILDRTPKQAIAAISKEVDTAMRKDGAYRDNTSIAILDF